MQEGPVTETLRELEDYGDSYNFVARVLELSSRGSEGDQVAVSVLNHMLERCETTHDWGQNNRWCSIAMKALARTKTPESLKTLLGFISRLPGTAPFGIIDLLGSILPLYRKIIVARAREMATNPEKESIRAIGVQTLCNMYLEGLLPGDQARHLESLIQKFTKDRYSTEHLTEMVRLSMENKKDLSLLDDLIESGFGDDDPTTQILGFIDKELEDF